MTKLLTEVIRQIVELPEDRQDDAARVLMLMLKHDPEHYRLSDEQLREVDEAIADVDAGNFASDQDIDRVFAPIVGMSVRWSRQSREHLVAIRAYIREHNTDAAERVVADAPYIIVFELWDDPAAVVITAIAHGEKSESG